MEGFGILYYADNKKVAYEGHWKDNKFNGSGKVYNENVEEMNEPFDHENFDDVSKYWTCYEGDFVDDMKSGGGKLILANGEKYIGLFKNDLIHGRGSFLNLKGEMIKGTWD